MAASARDDRRDPLRVVRFEAGGRRFAALVVDMHDDADLPTPLTRAEREVARLVREGHSNAQIAAARKTSVHTVANQIAAIMRKLGVGSRVEIALARTGART
jgi:DNA-binding CsgD family transcriptional regulator